MVAPPTARPATSTPRLLVTPPRPVTRAASPSLALTTSTHRPDLVIRDARIEWETGDVCTDSPTQLGTTVVLENVGRADAGSFAVELNSVEQTFVPGLVAGGILATWLPFYAAGGETIVVVDANGEVEEDDEGNNILSRVLPIPTPAPTCTSSPTRTRTATPTGTPTSTSTLTPVPPPDAVSVLEGQISIDTYPFASFTSEVWDENHSMSYLHLDRGAYNSSGPAPTALTYRTLVVENEYLKLTFLPDLGGRLYEVLFKPTGHVETYRNPVVKPSPWGPPEMGWWLAVGGIEWCLPVEEHGYEWAVPWLATVEEDASGVTVWLRDSAEESRIRAEIAVRLEAGAGSFSIRPRVENPTSTPLAVKYWTNAMLAPGGQNSPSAKLRFVLPDAVTAVTVHSRGDEALPGYGERMPWPIVNGVDLSQLGNWNRWLGFFEDPAAGVFVSVYDEEFDEGVIRVFSADVARGSKVFAHGWKDPIPAANWTDDDSSYVEIHSGPASTFDESVTLPAGGHIQWTEVWYPVAGLGGLRYANQTAALNLTAGGREAHVAVAVTRPWSGQLVLLLDGQEEWRTGLSLEPGQAFKASVPLGPDAPATGQLAISLNDADGVTVAQYGATYDLE